MKYNNIIYLLISLFLIFNILITKPILPFFIIKLFQNSIFKFIIILYILYKSNDDLHLSVFLTLCFLLIMHIINNQKVNEMFDSIKENTI